MTPQQSFRSGHEMYDGHTTMSDANDAYQEQMNTSDADRVTQKAKWWRDDNGYHGKGGVVVVFEGEVQGWVNALRDPQHWQPGSIAVAEDGACYQAEGGNDYDGAECWRERVSS